MFSDPKKNIDQLKLQLGAFVADFGAGSGHYIFAAREAVGDKGKVFAIDIQKDLLVRIKAEATKRKFGNVEVVWGDVEKKNGSRIRDGVLDAIIISNLMFQVENKGEVAQEAARTTKTGARLLVIDWTDSFGGLGPEKKAVFTKAQATELFQTNGFLFEREIDAGAHHYGIIFKKV
jgi:ubiquinone/menaquinone biosynthesis C-methylase UbiE